MKNLLARGAVALAASALFLGVGCEGAEAKVEVTKGKDGTLTVEKDGEKIDAETIKVKANGEGVKVEVKDTKGETKVVVDEKTK